MSVLDFEDVKVFQAVNFGDMIQGRRGEREENVGMRVLTNHNPDIPDLALVSYWEHLISIVLNNKCQACRINELFLLHPLKHNGSCRP